MGSGSAEGAFKIVVDCAFGGTGPLLPSILGSLGCDLLSLNAYVDEHKASLGFESLSLNIQQVSRLVKDSGADLGAVIDSSGERVFLIDDKGRHVDLNSALLLFVHLVSAKYHDASIAVPVSITSGVEAVAAKSGNSVVRTKVSRNALMDAALNQDLVFAGAGAGGYIFPDFLPAYDAMISLVKLLELLTYTGSTPQRQPGRASRFQLSDQGVLDLVGEHRADHAQDARVERPKNGWTSPTG